MMWHTSVIFTGLSNGTYVVEQKFVQSYLPKWDKLDKIGHSMITRVLFGIGYFLFYLYFAPNAWWFLLLPIHFFIGPIQGATVNWCGHKYGYSNFSNGDHSKNTSPWGVLLMGELFQNNHHYASTDANFAKKWFEFDLTYIIMRGLHKIKVIQLVPVNK